MNLTQRTLLWIVLYTGVATLPCWAQNWQSLGRITATSQLPNGVELTAGPSKMLVTAVTDSVFRVRVAFDGTFPKDFSWTVMPDALSSKPTVKIQNSSDTVDLSLSAGRVRIFKNPLRLAFLDNAGAVINE